MIRTLDIAWLAGLLEGEGCFTIDMKKGKPASIRLYLGMTDKEPVEKAARLIGKSIRLRMPKSKGGHPYKTQYVFKVSGDIAAQWLMTIYPLMGPRRQSKIRDCLDVWRNMPGVTSSNRCHGTAHHNAKLAPDKVRAIREAVARGQSKREVAKDFGISDTHVGHIVHHRAWRHVES